MSTSVMTKNLTVEIQEVFPFERRRMLEVVEAKHVRGKLVLTIA